MPLARRGTAGTPRIDTSAARERLDAIAQSERGNRELDPANGTRWWLQDGVAERAVVLLHGLTNTPQQYAQLGPQLYGDGHSVIAPRFPYHGYRDRLTTAPEALTVGDMLATALESIGIAGRLARRVDVVGISVGATLAAWLATRVALGRVVAVAPFFGIIYTPRSVSDALAWTFQRLPNTFVWWDPIRKADQLPLHAYPRFPTRPLAAALGLATGFERIRLARMHADRLFLVLNAHEPIVNNAVATRRCQALVPQGIGVETVVLRDLPFHHDIIEPTLPHTPREAVYPVLRAIVAGAARRDY